ncbi:MAG: Rpn family recombination-promoting nuclease/putative transposase [Gemmatimonadota bacterium]|nr:Rpn family recombination-promoting nuclease/putative transposase [Gemmatimonadota bacterium]
MARKHDETYKLIFSQRTAVEDLVRGLAGGKLAEELDFDTLEPLPTDLVSDELVRRQADLLWRIRFRGSWLYLLILLEFQSKVDRFMALRILTYICLTYEELVRRGEIKAGDKLPPLLPVTVYNGRARWRAATDISELIAPVPEALRRYLPRAAHVLLDLQRIGGRDPTSKDLATSLGRAERDPSEENLRRVVRDMADRFPGPVYAELRKVLVTWLAGAWRTSRIRSGSPRSPTRSSTATATRSCSPEWGCRGATDSDSTSAPRPFLTVRAAQGPGVSTSSAMRRPTNPVPPGAPDRYARCGPRGPNRTPTPAPTQQPLLQYTHP